MFQKWNGLELHFIQWTGINGENSKIPSCEGSTNLPPENYSGILSEGSNESF